MKSCYLTWCSYKQYFSVTYLRLDIYKDIKELTPEDTLQIIMESDDKEEIAFFAMLGNYLLQQKQKKVVEANLF